MLSFMQILLMLLVFLTTFYWFLCLLDVHFLDFVKPLTIYLSDLIKTFYDKDIVVSGVIIDGSLLLFAFLGIFFTICITQFKGLVNSHIQYIRNLVRVYKNKLEMEFNKQLQDELKEILSKYNKVAILLQFETMDLLKYSAKNVDLELKKSEAYKTFGNICKVLKYCEIKELEKGTLILIDDVKLLDNILAFMYSSFETIKSNFRKDKILLKTYLAVSIYDTKERLKNETLSYLERMLNLRHLDQAVCLGILKLKYDFENIQSFFVFKKEVCDIVGESEVYMIVKKD